MPSGKLVYKVEPLANLGDNYLTFEMNLNRLGTEEGWEWVAVRQISGKEYIIFKRPV